MLCYLVNKQNIVIGSLIRFDDFFRAFNSQGSLEDLHCMINKENIKLQYLIQYSLKRFKINYELFILNKFNLISNKMNNYQIYSASLI